MKLKASLLGTLTCTALLMVGAVHAADPIETINPYHVRYGLNYEAGFERTAFGFAAPVITLIPGYHTNHVYRPVIIVPAGYDPTKDYQGSYDKPALGDSVVRGRGPSKTGVRMEDKIGNAIYFMDAVKGDLVARIRGTNPLPKDSAGAQVTEASLDNEITNDDMKHSIPAGITQVDSTGDGLTDRIYFVDVIGNVWRADLNARDVAAESLTQNWVLTKIAKLGTDGDITLTLGSIDGDGDGDGDGDSDSDNTYAQNDRRFFSAIDVVRTRRSDGTAVDALLVGSGNIADPKSTKVVDLFFMIYDENVTRLDETPTGWLPITLNNLAAVTSTASEVPADKDGWYFRLPSNGEKVVSQAITVDGTVYFTTLTPLDAGEKGCAPPATLPENKMYAIDINKPATSSGTAMTGDGMAFQQLDPYVDSTGKVSIIMTNKDIESPGNRRLYGKDRAWHSQGQ